MFPEEPKQPIAAKKVDDNKPKRTADMSLAYIPSLKAKQLFAITGNEKYSDIALSEARAMLGHRAQLSTIVNDDLAVVT